CPRRARQLQLPGDLQHHHVGRTRARQRTHAAAHELRRVVDDCDARRLRPRAQRAHAQVHELTRPLLPQEFVMTKEMIISSNGHETMVAILEDDLAAEIFVERERRSEERRVAKECRCRVWAYSCK